MIGWLNGQVVERDAGQGTVIIGVGGVGYEVRLSTGERLWAACEHLTHGPACELSERLRHLLEPTLASRLAGVDAAEAPPDEVDGSSRLFGDLADGLLRPLEQQVEARYRGQAATPERDAELAGATNRVAIERRRYDKVATEYNDAAGSLTGSLGAMFFGLPDRVPLSTELQ